MDRSSYVVTAFLEHLVDQLLPTKSAAQDTPAQSKQQLVAKQVHSLVLLYNFYHRKQHPEVPFLAFEEFCGFLVALRPTLSTYMKFTQNSSHEADEEEFAIVDAANQLSLTEEKITEACDICRHLDASKDVPSTEGWPITKVAVLLIDCRLEDCFLTFGSTTKGVWSLIEQEADEVDAAEEELMRIAYSAVKKATGKVGQKGDRSCQHRHMEEHGGTTSSSNDDHEAPLRAANPMVIQWERCMDGLLKQSFIN